MRVLITGAAGFMGRHLSRLALSKRGVRVYGVVRPGSKHRALAGVRALRADILDGAALERIVRSVRPDRVYHLAAQASVARSWKEPEKTLAVNVEGTRCLLEALLTLKKAPRVLVAGSAEAYGASARAGRKLRETDALEPLNPYAVSKAAQEALALGYFLSYGLPVVRTRAFNHIGPGQAETFAVPSFARQTALIRRGKRPPVIEVGDLSVRRDFTDARDAARAYWLALEKGKAGEVYNVASGRTRCLKDVLTYYLRTVSVKIEVRPSRRRLRPTDLRALAADARKLRARTGWKPRIPFGKTLRDIRKDWEGRLDG